MARTLNWLRILASYGVEYIERGANVKRGNVNIRCPFCGNADPSHHMGLNLDTGAWGCWRNQNHRGKSPLRLLMRLLGVSYHKACEIAGITDDYIDPDGFDALAARLMGRQALIAAAPSQRSFLQFPKAFRAITAVGATARAWTYMTEVRGFDEAGLESLVDNYGVRFDATGDFRDRVILPFYMDEVLVTWTGRAITATSLRYKDLDLDTSIVPAKETLFNHDAAYAGGRRLVLVEGPMDALKLDVYGRKFGVRAVALATNSIQEEQIFILDEVADRFGRIEVMMDNASTLGVVDSMRMKGRLSQIKNLTFVPVPGGRKDAGDLTPGEVVAFCKGKK